MKANKKYLLRGFAVWCVIIVAESLHGTVREFWLKPHLGDFRARQIAFFTGMALILTIALFCVRWLRAESRQRLLQIGLLWVVLTLAFEFTLGRLVLGYSSERMFEDYNLLKGGLMGLGMLWLFFAPLLAARVRSQPT
jgi:hypothetical protein